MGNKVQTEMEKIEIPAELHQRSKQGILKAKSEMNRNQSVRLKSIFNLAASLLIIVGIYGMYHLNFQKEEQETLPSLEPYRIKEEGVHIPSIQLPEGDTGETMNMIGLIVYNGKIYTEADSTIDPDQAKALAEEKLGRTKGTIDEWSSQDEYTDEFASTIGEFDVYSVKGYDPNFRIMAYDGLNHAKFYESLNGMTVQDGEDIFGKLKLSGNVVGAQYRNYHDWNNGHNLFHSIQNAKVVQEFIAALNRSIPYSYREVEPILGDFYNNEEYKRLTIHLADGIKADLIIIKDGYIRYGFSEVYFKMNDEVFSKMWEQMM